MKTKLDATITPVCIVKMNKKNKLLKGRTIFSPTGTRPVKRRFTKKFSTLTTYTINLIKFYHFIAEWRGFMLKNFWFLFIILQIFQLPVKVLTCFLKIFRGLPGSITKSLTPKRLKRSSPYAFERTTLNYLVRRSIVKDFLNKYVDYDAVMEEWHSTQQTNSTVADVDEFFSDLGSTRMDRIYSHDHLSVNEVPLVNLADCFIKSCIYSAGIYYKY
jgi:hypothetical protein